MRIRSHQRLGGVSLAACAAVVGLASAEAGAASVFVSVLGGGNERPDPVATGGAGSAAALLSGDVGSFVLSYTLSFADLGSDAVAGHIHSSILPPGRDPVEQTGPVVHPLEGDFGGLDTAGTLSGEWRFDDAELPLTDALADSLMDGELYFNLHTAGFPDGEVRGQIRAVGGGNGGGTNTGGTAIPLPPPLLLGLFGLGAAGLASRRLRR
jgi:hypothetical protein